MQNAVECEDKSGLMQKGQTLNAVWAPYINHILNDIRAPRILYTEFLFHHIELIIFRLLCSNNQQDESWMKCRYVRDASNTTSHLIDRKRCRKCTQADAWTFLYEKKNYKRQKHLLVWEQKLDKYLSSRLRIYEWDFNSSGKLQRNTTSVSSYAIYQHWHLHC